MLVMGAVALSSVGCASGPRANLRALQYRSVFDLGCPAQGLQLHHVDRRTKVVVGCGRRLVYVESCETHGLNKECTWMLDSPVYAQTSWPEVPTVPVAVAPASVPHPTVVLAPAPPPAPEEGRPIRTDLDGREQTVIPPRRDARRPVRTDLFDDEDQARILEHRR